MKYRPDVIVEAEAIIGEGPCWDSADGLLYWVDIAGKTLYVSDPRRNTTRAISVGQFVGSVAVRNSAQVVLALEKGFYILDLHTERLEQIADPEARISTNRFNDGKCDAAGRFWAGTQSSDGAGGAGKEERTAALYFLDQNRRVHKAFGDVSISNGITWSPDNKIMYYIDSKIMGVAAFDFNLETGNLSNRRSVVEIPSGHGIPDGMTTDQEGMIWIAEWDGYQVSRWDPRSGRCVEKVKIAAAKVTSCVFGGPNLDELYITTARYGLGPGDHSQPHAGSVFRIKTETRGVECYRYSG